MNLARVLSCMKPLTAEQIALKTKPPLIRIMVWSVSAQLLYNVACIIMVRAYLNDRRSSLYDLDIKVLVAQTLKIQYEDILVSTVLHPYLALVQSVGHELSHIHFISLPWKEVSASDPHQGSTVSIVSMYNDELNDSSVIQISLTFIFISFLISCIQISMHPLSFLHFSAFTSLM